MIPGDEAFCCSLFQQGYDDAKAKANLWKERGFQAIQQKSIHKEPMKLETIANNQTLTEKKTDYTHAVESAYSDSSSEGSVADEVSVVPQTK